jgi:AbiJ-like protein/abortive infection Abi-like protein
MSEKSITEVTRRNIIDRFVLDKVSWSGRLEEQEFLARLYNVAEMPSNDPRFSNAFGDIRQHRVYNFDWDDDWLFYDPRFKLFHAPDEEFLRFLCEVLHPVVQPDATEVDRIRSFLNEQLERDGWTLREQMQLSGRPVFAAFRSIGSEIQSVESARVVIEAVGAEYVSRQVTRMQTSLFSEPDVAIGTAKEFVETVCKTILANREIVYEPHQKMPKLVKQTAAALELIPNDIAHHGKATETVKRLLSNLSSVSDGLVELRNLFGTGHGKEASVVGLSQHHARLAVGCATTLAVFLWEAHSATPRKS